VYHVMSRRFGAFKNCGLSLQIFDSPGGCSQAPVRQTYLVFKTLRSFLAREDSSYYPAALCFSTATLEIWPGFFSGDMVGALRLLVSSAGD